MSVLVTGMGMPESCLTCNQLDWDGGYRCRVTQVLIGNILRRGVRNEDCPLVDVPAHGRLIDGGALEKDGWWALLRTKTASSENLEGIMEEYMRLDSVRTIIPAEEGE